VAVALVTPVAAAKEATSGGKSRRQRLCRGSPPKPFATKDVNRGGGAGGSVHLRCAREHQRQGVAAVLVELITAASRGTRGGEARRRRCWGSSPPPTRQRRTARGGGGNGGSRHNRPARNGQRQRAAGVLVVHVDAAHDEATVGKRLRRR